MASGLSVRFAENYYCGFINPSSRSHSASSATNMPKLAIYLLLQFQSVLPRGLNHRSTGSIDVEGHNCQVIIKCSCAVTAIVTFILYRTFAETSRSWPPYLKFGLCWRCDSPHSRSLGEPTWNSPDRFDVRGVGAGNLGFFRWKPIRWWSNCALSGLNMEQITCLKPSQWFIEELDTSYMYTLFFAKLWWYRVIVLPIWICTVANRWKNIKDLAWEILREAKSRKPQSSPGMLAKATGKNQPRTAPPSVASLASSESFIRPSLELRYSFLSHLHQHHSNILSIWLRSINWPRENVLLDSPVHG